MKKYLIVLVLALALSITVGNVAEASPGQQGGGNVHYVRFGETLTGIAYQYGVTVNAILHHNGLANPNVIYVGQPLRIPTNSYGLGPSGSGYGACGNHHVVAPGDTLSGIAYKYGTTIHELQRLNNLANKDVVFAGQNLCIPGGSSGYAPQSAAHRGQASNAYYHTVAKGETLSGISHNYSADMWNVTQANNMNRDAHIYPGQQIHIPDYRPPAQPAHYVPEKPHRPEQSPSGPPKHKPQPRPEPKPPKLYLRLGRNTGYQEWGRPDYGIDDCLSNWFDDGQPVTRFTAEVLLTNNSVHTIPGDWASSRNVIFHTQSGARKHACKYMFDQRFLDENRAHIQQSYSNLGPDIKVPPYNLPLGGYIPPDLEHGDTADVTFYTHIERGDIVTKMEFVALGECFDPNSGHRVLCEY